MKFNIAKKGPREIAALAPIVEMVEENGFPDTYAENMVKWICYRYDSECEEVNHKNGEDAKDAEATRLSGWERVRHDDGFYIDGLLDPKSPLATFYEAIRMFFEQYDDMLWEHVCSVKFAISDGHDAIRRQVPPNADVQVQIALGSNKGTLADRNLKMIRQVTDIIAELAKESSAAKSALVAKESKVKSKRDPATGKIIDKP